MALQDVLRWLLPKADHFYEILEKQAVAAHEGAVALGSAGSAAERAEKLAGIEARGDDLVRQMEEALGATYVTPIDREDLHRVASELDDVLDSSHAAARAAVIVGIEELTADMKAMVDILAKTTGLLKDSVPLLRKHQYEAILDRAREVKKLEAEGDRLYREAVTRLFSDDAIDAKQLLRERTILDDLATAIDRTDLCGWSLANVSVKNG